MKVSQLIEKLNLSVFTSPDFDDRDVDGCYIGDLLSWVMGKAQSGNIWITIMNNVNIVAVATLTDVSCILLCENVKADESVIEKANSQGIIILGSELNAYELASKLSGEI